MNSFSFNIQQRTGALRLCALLLCLFAGGQVFASAPPNWTVDPDDYEFNLNVTAQVYFAGVQSNASGSIVGAFIGNELRGVANATIINGEAFFFLTVYSNVYNGETVYFKLYHAPGDAIYPATESVVFLHNASFGNVDAPFEINIDPNADFAPELLPLLADTTLQSIPFETVDLADYLVSLDGDPVTYLLLPGSNLNASVVNGILTVSPVSGGWTGTDSVRIIARENTPGQLADTIWGLFTVLPDYGPPVWQIIPGQEIFPGETFVDFDLDGPLQFNGPCREFDFNVYPFSGSAPDPAWPVIDPGSQPMSIVARPLYADSILAGAGSKLAAYVNGTLAGWAAPSGVWPGLTYNLSLKNVGAGNISFKFYHAANQYLYEESSSLNFVAGGSAGSVSSPVLLQLSPLVPSISASGVVHIEIDDPTWMGDYPIDFIVWDCDYPNLRRDTFQAIFSIITDIRPDITSAAAVNFEENACYVLYDTQSSDPNDSEGMGLTYSLDGGADAAKFSIDGQTGILTWANGFNPDFESPADADANNKYEVNIKVTNSSNLFDVLALTVTVTNQSLEPFAVTINGGTSLFCTNGSVNLQANGAVSYLWNTGSTQATILVTTSGTYTVTGTSTGACTATASIVVAPQPSITASGSATPVCQGSNIDLSSSPSGGTTPYASFAWTGPDNYSANVEDPAGFPATPAAEGTYTVVLTDAAGCTATSSVSIAVSGNTAPTVTASSNSPVCVGATIALSASPSGGSGNGYTFLWSGPNNYAATGQNPPLFSASTNAAGTYQVIVTDAAGCTGTGTASVTVHANPTVTASSNSPVSIGGTILLTSAASGGSGSGYTYLWGGPNNFTSTDAQPAGFTASTASAGVYTVTLTDGNGCTGTASTTVAVVACPTITAAVNGAVCDGGTINLQSTPTGGALPYASFLWSGPNNYSANVEDPAGFPASMSGNGTYTVTVTDQLGCTASAAVNVTVNPNPAITAQNNGPMCSGSTAMVSSSPSGGTPGYSFVWTGPDFFGAFVEDPAPFTATVAASGIYQVKVTDSKGCSAITTTNLVVNAKPTVTASNNGPLCLDATLDLQSNPSGGSGVYTFNWNGPVSYTSMLEDPSRPMIQQIHAGTYNVTVTDNTGCSATASTILSVSINNAPTITASSNSPLCAGSALTLGSTPDDGTPPYLAFSWSGPNSYSSNLEDPIPFVVLSNGAGVYTVTVTDTKNCKGTASVTVNVFEPALSPSSNSPVCPGATLQLNAGGPSGSGITYSWSGPNNFQSSVKDPSIPNATPAASGTYFVTVNDNGCLGMSSVTASVGDVIPPTITCPANTTLAADASCSSLLGSYTALSVSDNCNPNPAVTQSPAPGTVLNGHNDVETVTLTANDGNGNTASCTFTVTLKDVTPPSITCPVNVTIAADASCSGTIGTQQPLSVSDNCAANPTVTQSPAASTVLSGHNDVETVTLTANDGNGNTASCNFTVTLKDVTPPSITCPANVTIAADASCSGVVGAYQAVSVSDNCTANPTVTQSPVASTVLSGHNDVETVIITADDGNGNMASCNFTVTLKDVTPPSITCPANTTIAADAMCSGVVGAYQAVSVSDNCTANPTVTQSPAPSTVLSGHNDVETVTLTADDGNGNTASCTFIVMLKDVTPPSITCPANTTIAADAMCSGVLGAYQAVSVSDNCTANPTVTQSPAASTVLMGHNDVETVTLTADDGNGNMASCSFTVTLKDITPPSITCPANTTIAADASCSGIVGLYGPVALSDNCASSIAVSQTPPISTVLNGHNDVETVTLTANDGNGNTAFCTFTVTLKDVTPPSITCPANTTLSADANCSSLLGAYSAVLVSDNCTASPAVTQNPAASTVLMGHNDVETVTLTADDGNGNTTSCSFTVTLLDITPPTVVCKPYTAALSAAGTASITTGNVFQSGADNCGMVNQVSVMPNAFTCANLGANTVVLTVNDGNGNTSTCNAVVTVVDLIPPTMFCTQITVALNAQGLASVTADQIDDGSFDNCTITNLTLSQTTFTCANLGDNFVTLTATDQSGNTNTCQGKVTVVDNIPPTALCQNATLNLNAAGQATLTPAQINNGSFDNCTIVSLALSQTLFTCANLGVNTVTLTVTDQSGNTATCTATVTVNDLIAPTALCKNTTANLGANGSVTVLPPAVNNGSFDNCSFTLSLLPNTFTCANIGINTVTLRATDASGNSSTCTAKVTVKDALAPTALCKNPTIFLNNQGQATLTAAQVNNNSFDNCSISSLFIDETTFNCGDLSSTQTVTFVVTDGSGNTGKCQSSVTVKDNLAPTAICSNVTVVLGPNGLVAVYGANLAAGSSDNCGVTSYTPVAKVYSSANLGNNSLPITVKDWSGNAATCVSIVTVLPAGPSDRPEAPRDQPTNFAGDDEDDKAIPGLPASPNSEPVRGFEGKEQVVFNMALYPNPTSGPIVLVFELKEAQSYHVAVYDPSGRTVLTEDGLAPAGSNELPLDLSLLHSGLYVVELRTETERVVKRVVKE